jgi:hypothetical protein
MPKYNQDGSIELIIEHPIYGLIPFTASPNDTEEYGMAIYQDAIKGKYGTVEPYVAQPEPTEAELIAQHNKEMEAKRIAAYRNESDPLMFKWQRGEATQQEWLDAVASIKARYPMRELP